VAFWSTFEHTPFSACQCYGHTDECIYDEEVPANRSSIDIHGVYEGGGVCQYCRHNTMGINCEKCVPGYYHPYGVPLNATDSCQGEFSHLFIHIHIVVLLANVMLASQNASAMITSRLESVRKELVNVSANHNMQGAAVKCEFYIDDVNLLILNCMCIVGVLLAIMTGHVAFHAIAM
jgi:hypothetical protein